MIRDRPSVLVVDDIEANRVAMGAQLAELDCELVMVADGNDALRQLLRRPFAVMLLDVQMPGMDGFEVARLARANPATQDVPIVFVTAMHASHEAQLRGYGAGAVDLLYKPLDAFVLRSKVQVFLDLDRSRRRLRDEVEAHRRTAAEVDACAALIGALDAQRMLDRLAEGVVPRLADLCRIVLIEPERSATAMDLPPRKLDAACALRRRTAPTARAPWAAGGVLDTGRSELHVELSDADLRKHARDGDELRVVRELAPASSIIVPLPARGETIGALTLVSCDPARRYGGSELAIAEELGRRVGLAIDNLLLHAEAREAIAARDEFLSIASHELRTPITSLVMQHEILGEALRPAPGEPLPPAVAERLRVAARQTTRLAGLIENLLDVSRIMTGHLAIEAVPLDLAELVREICAGFEEVARRAGCRLDLALEPAEGRWDCQRLEQVLTNLLSNAIKFGPGKPIEVSVVRRGADAVLEVRDQGIGIASDDVERIFGRFERAVSSHHYGGLGLGLYIARHGVELQGGRLAVSSLPGRGATFVVTLPVEPPAVVDGDPRRPDCLTSIYAGLVADPRPAAATRVVAPPRSRARATPT